MYRKTKGLVLPYIFFSVPFFLAFCALYIERVGEIRNVNFFNPNSYLLGTEWFLIVLYLCLFVYLLLNEMGNNRVKYLSVTAFFALSYIGCIYGYWGDGEYHHQLDYLTMAGLTLPFLYVGSFYFKYEHTLKQNKIIFIIVSFLMVSVIGVTKPVVCIPWLIVCRNPLFYAIAPIAAFVLFITVVFSLSEICFKLNFIEKAKTLMFKVLCFWGEYSLFVLILHWIMKKLVFSQLKDVILVPLGLTNCTLANDIISLFLAVVFCSLSAYIGKYLKRIPFFFK